jgi:hypothetical protein
VTETTPPAEPASSKRWYQRWWVWAIAALVVLVAIAGSMSESGDLDDAAADTTTTLTEETTTSQAEESTTTAPEQTTTSAASETTTSQPEDTTTTTEVATTTTTPSVTFGDGSWIIGTDIESGTYRNDDSSDLCLWQRLSGFSGEFEDVIASNLTEAITIVTIEDTDAGFDAQDCGTWSNDLSPRTSSPEADFGDGTWIVGSDIAPGLWRNDDSSDLCLWQRLSGFGGEFEDIIASNLTEEVATVEVSATDVGFDTLDCGTWTKIG